MTTIHSFHESNRTELKIITYLELLSVLEIISTNDTMLYAPVCLNHLQKAQNVRLYIATWAYDT